MISIRLHAQIFAWSTGRPLLGLSFEEKSDAFLESVGAERAELSELSPRPVIEWLEHV
jgi:polysaccharide pyruvyl transferase WcaK-like protein